MSEFIRPSVESQLQDEAEAIALMIKDLDPYALDTSQIEAYRHASAAVIKLSRNFELAHHLTRLPEHVPIIDGLTEENKLLLCAPQVTFTYCTESGSPLGKLSLDYHDVRTIDYFYTDLNVSPKRSQTEKHYFGPHVYGGLFIEEPINTGVFTISSGYHCISIPFPKVHVSLSQPRVRLN